jgi:uncharacterized membrane protein
MEYIVKISRSFYAIALIVYGIQQFIYSDFRNVFLPAWQTGLVLLPLWAYLFGIMLIVAGIALISGKMAREVLLVLGTILLALFCFVHIPYELTSEPHSSWHLGVWGNALKALALSGGAFVIAGTFHEDSGDAQNKSVIFKFLERIIPFGEIFFSITMICFGTTHFLYSELTAALVPAWIPDKLSWTYFAGVALICSGVAIILDIRKKIIASLLGMMILSWFFLLHLPIALANPYAQRGNSLASAFDALAFSGIAFVIAFTARTRKKDELS